MMDWYYGGCGGSGWMLISPLLWIVFWGIVLYFLFTLVRQREGTSKERNNAMEILKERYAKGEITKEEFETMKKDIL